MEEDEAERDLSEDIAVNYGVSVVRRRVYCFGVISMLLALAQIALFLVMLTFSISIDYSDYQVAGGSAVMTVVTAVYLFLAGRLLFLLYERRYEEARGPEWLWWFCSLAVILFNILLVVWFWLISDVIPTAMSGVAVLFYSLFFFFASRDIKHIRENDNGNLRSSGKNGEAAFCRANGCQ